MKLTSSLHTPIVPHFSTCGSSRRRAVKTCRRIRIHAAMRDDGTNGGRDGSDGPDGRLVDSDLPVLRRRIREVTSADKGGIVLPFSNRVISAGTQHCRAIFESEACQVLGAVRLDPTSPPRIEIGVTVTVSISVPVPVLVIMLYVMDAAQGVLDLMHQNTEEDAMH